MTWGTVLPFERRQSILSEINTHGSASVRELAERFGVSVVTIRRDLDELERKGLIIKTHGGAVQLNHETHAELRLTEREAQYQQEKERIGAKAAQLVQPGQTIIMDEGSTCLAVARHLRNYSQLTVITNGLRVAAELLGTTIQLIVVGGVCDHESAMLYGPEAEKTYEGLRADVYFMGIDAFSAEDGIMDANFLQVGLKTAKANCARRVIGVAHGAKYGRRAIARIGPLTMLDALITDGPASPELKEALTDNGIECIEV